MEELRTNAYFDDEPVQDKLPVFLKVLCILTFISCAYSLLSTIYGIATQGELRRSLYMMSRVQANGSNEVMEQITTGLKLHINELEKWTRYGYYITLGNVALTFAGALLMWKRRKSGFYIYVAGQALSFSGLFGMYSAAKDIPYFGMGLILLGLAGAVFSLAFIIMYAVNLKHLR